MNIWGFTFLLAAVIRAMWADPATLYIWGLLMLGYLAGNFILSRIYPNSFRRKFAIASWDEPREPILHLKEEVDIEPIEEFLQKYNTENPEAKVTMTAVFARALGAALSRTGRTYGKIAFGQFIPLKSVDLSVAVDIAGENIANLVLKGCNLNGIAHLAGQMRKSVKPLKEKKDPNFNKQVSTFQYVPAFLFDALMRIIIWVNYDLGIPIPFLKMPENAFGCGVLTNVSGWHVRDTFAPLVPPLMSVVTALMNKPVERAVVRDGKIVIRKVMYLNITFDHRFADGSDADKMIRALHEVLENPNKFV